MFLRVQRAVCSARQTRKAPARLCSGRPDQPSSSSSSSQIHAEKQRRRRRRDEAILSGPHSEAAGKTAKWSEKERISYRSLAPPGTKKDTGVGLPSAFSPDFVESGWYQWWEREGFFRPERHERLPQAVEKTFCLCIPPPNVTGSLHLGHALTVALQDALVRWRRMQGYRVLWVPGCDHAGIATQSVVERRLQREGRTRQQLKREEFLQEVWRWKEDKGDEIYHQLRALGASLDWSRTCFTMDPGYSRAVTAAFVRLSDAGLIYRSEALVNWSCALESAISDIEVEAVELSGVSTLSLPGYQEGVEFGTLTTFAYPVEGLEAEVSVSTTRPETMLGDVAVAVHPHDPRYQALHGKQCRHPFTNRLLPIITDPEVDMELGTGALKVTPAHDHTDFKLSQKHSLPRITVIGGDGTMTPSCGEWLQGVKRFTARQLVVDALVEKQLFRGKRSHAMTLPVCSRSGDVVEPLLKKQWFLRCQEMAQKALQAVEDGELEIVPQRHVKTWTNWLSNISDWCISRQLWWGHQIPAYRVRLPGHAQHADQEVWVCGHSQEEALHRAAVRHGVKPEDVTLTQDPDVLDTWFSSGLFPFAMLGWPRQTLDLQHFYPNSLLETGSDLIFFWVARMVMLGTELTGQLPFKQVLFHSLVRDKYGRKMSKSLGNVIDPLDVVHGVSLQGLEEKVRKGNLDLKEQQVALEAQRRDFPHGIPQCGADALRFALCSHRVQGEDISLSVSQVLSCRHFCNKMWQTVRFTLGALEGQAAPAGTPEEVAPLSSMDRWIGSRLYSTVLQCEEALEAYQLHTATAALHSFWVHSLCDVYMEYMKPLLHTQVDGGVRRAATAVLYHCVCVSLALLSPFMPFITEELWQRLQPAPPAAPSLSLQPYPRSSQLAHWYFPEEERDFLLVQEVVRVARSLRAQCGMTKERPAMSAVCSPSQARVLLHFQSAIEPLSRISSLHVHCPDRADLCGAAPLAGGLVGLVDHHCQLHLHIQGGKDVSRQIVHLSQKRDGLRPKVKELQLKVSSPQYRQKVPAHIQQQTDNRLSALLQELKSVEDQLEVLRGGHGGHGGHGAR